MEFSIQLRETCAEEPSIDIDATVAAARSGDYAAFSTLTEHFHSLVFHTTLRLLRNTEDAEDTVQETFIRALTCLNSFRGESKFSTWLTRIAINSALMRLRSQRQRPTISLDHLPDEIDGESLFLKSNAPSPEELCYRSEMTGILHEALSRLPATLRHTLSLQVENDLTIAEVAQGIGLTVGATRSRLLRGRIALQRELSRGADPARHSFQLR